MNGDAELLRRYAETSSDEAFTEFVERHVGLVYHAALRQLDGDAHRAKDVTQLVFNDLARKAGSLGRHPAIASWLHKSTRYAAAKARRAEQTRQKYEREAETMNALLNENVPPADWERMRPMIDDALNELSERDREAVLLRFFEGRSFAEVGTVLALGENGARMRVERALYKLHALLARRGITSTTAALGTVLANQMAMGAPAGLAASVAGSALSGAAAGVAGAGSIAATWSFIMTTKGTALLSVVGALALATAVHQLSQARAGAMALAAAGNNHAALRDQLADLETRARVAVRAPVRVVTRDGGSSSTFGTADVAAEKMRQDQALRQFLARDPELRKLRGDAALVAFKSDFGPFLRSIGFTPEQIEQAAELAVQNPSMDEGQRAVELENLESSVDLEKFRAMFGGAAADRMAQHLKLRDAAALVDALSGNLVHTEERFTTAQAERLAEIILSAKTDVITTATNSPGVSAGRALVDWDRVLVQAEPVLSPLQMQALRGMAALGRVEAQLAAAAAESAPSQKK